MKTELVGLAQITVNASNPRNIKNGKFEKLTDSLLALPKMLDLRPIVVDNSMTALGGNMRCRALAAIAAMTEPELKRRLSGIRDFQKKPQAERDSLVDYWLRWRRKPAVPVIKAGELTEAEQREFVIKDNAAFGEWDWDMLANEWDACDLADWGVDVWQEDGGGEAGRRGWNTQEGAGEAVCDMAERLGVYKRGDMLFLSFFKKSEEGIPLSAIKTKENVAAFAEKAAETAKGMLRLGNKKDWCIITAPARRHKDWNFSEAVCDRAAALLGIPFHPGAVAAKNRQRVAPEFTLAKEIGEPNIIVFDDILTTGSTLHAISELLQGKNALFIVGINNN